MFSFSRKEETSSSSFKAFWQLMIEIFACHFQMLQNLLYRHLSYSSLAVYPRIYQSFGWSYVEDLKRGQVSEMDLSIQLWLNTTVTPRLRLSIIVITWTYNGFINFVCNNQVECGSDSNGFFDEAQNNDYWGNAIAKKINVLLNSESLCIWDDTKLWRSNHCKYINELYTSKRKVNRPCHWNRQEIARTFTLYSMKVVESKGESWVRRNPIWNVPKMDPAGVRPQGLTAKLDLQLTSPRYRTSCRDWPGGSARSRSAALVETSKLWSLAMPASWVI